MTIGVSRLLTALDGSAGRDKSNLRPVPNLAQHIPAEEWNNVKNMVVELTGVLGRATGEDSESIVRALLGMPSGPLTARWRIAHDFEHPGYDSKVTVTGSGVAVRVAGGAANDGFGLLSLSHTGIAGTASYVHSQTENLIEGGSTPSPRFRFKTPSDLTASDVRMGTRKTDAASWLDFGWDHTTTARLYLKSATGGASTVKDIAVISPSTWYDVELRNLGTSVGVYINGALALTDATAGTILRAGDTVQPFGASITRFGAAATLLVDWFVTEGARV